MMAQPNIPNYYIPINKSDEAHAAYAAWSNHYAAGWPHAYPGFQPVPVPYGAPYPYPHPYPYPYPHPYSVQPAVPIEGPQPLTAAPEPKKDDDKRKAADDKNDKKEAKGDGRTLEYVQYYVPAGQPDRVIEGIHADGKYHMNYYGRTAEVVQTDRQKIQTDKGLWKQREKVPRAGPSDPFWVIDTKDNNETMIMRFDEIEGKLEGKWKVDERYGNSYFEKTGVIKAKTGWEL